MALNECTADTNVVRELSDSPALSSTELKAAFDGAADNIKAWLNETHLPQLESALSAKQDSLSLAASRALVSDSTGLAVASAVTSSELNRLAGVSENVQTQLDAKQKAVTSGTATPTGGSDGDIYIQYA